VFGTLTTVGRAEEDTVAAPAQVTTPLLQAASAFWPVPADVRVIHGRRARRPATREYVLLPSAARPHLVLPAGERRAAAAVIRGRNGSTALWRRAAHAAVAAAAGLGAADLVARDRLRVERDTGADREDIEVALARILGTPPVLSIRLGSPRANRKPVLQVLDRTGATLAFVKVGDNPATRELVDREAAALEVLADADLRLLRVPEVLHHGTWRGLHLLVLSALEGRRRLRQPAPWAAMAELARAGGTAGTQPLAASPFWARIRTDAAALRAPEAAERFTNVVVRVENRLGAADMDLGWAHGDWSSWNMAWRARHVDVWDWERFERSAPVASDALHHCFQDGMQRTGDPDRALAILDARAPQLVRAVGATAPSGAIVELYLLALAARYLTAAEGPLGEHVRPQAAWALDTLESRTAA
jgi:hypothetical protein